MEFCSANMDAWYYRNSVACNTMEFEFLLLSSLLVWSTPYGLPGRCGKCMHQHSTKWQKKKTLHILTHGAMRGCRLTSLVVCINDKIHDLRGKNVTMRSEIWTTNIRSLGFQDIRNWVISWKLILRSLGCIITYLEGLGSFLFFSLNKKDEDKGHCGWACETLPGVDKFKCSEAQVINMAQNTNYLEPT